MPYLPKPGRELRITQLSTATCSTKSLPLFLMNFPDGESPFDSVSHSPHGTRGLVHTTPPPLLIHYYPIRIHPSTKMFYGLINSNLMIHIHFKKRIQSREYDIHTYDRKNETWQQNKIFHSKSKKLA